MRGSLLEGVKLPTRLDLEQLGLPAFLIFPRSCGPRRHAETVSKRRVPLVSFPIVNINCFGRNSCGPFCVLTELGIALSKGENLERPKWLTRTLTESTMRPFAKK
jgi:hypothetical protein